jgi:heme oxygenase
MLTEKLKEETEKAHVDVEKALSPHLASIDSPAAYSKLLLLFYGYYNPVEQLIEKFIDEGIVADIKQRRKAELILNDRQNLNEQTTVNRDCIDLPAIHNIPTALGAMYVLEGSTLGGKYISKMIKTKIGLGSDKGVSFFNGYGSETGSKWKSFKSYINKYTGKINEEKEIINAANETFAKMKRWIEAN